MYYLARVKFETFDDKSKILLPIQYKAMLTYLECLEQRIKL